MAPWRPPLTADDLLPLVAKLPRDEQVRLAQLALRRTGRATLRRIEPRPYALTSSPRRRMPGRGMARAGKQVRRGEIRWCTFAAPDKRRAVLLLTRSNVIDTLNEIIVARATRTGSTRTDSPS